MKEKFKKFLTGKGITEETFKAMSSDEMAELYNEFNDEQQKELQKLIEEKATKADIQTALDEFREAQKEQLKTLNKAIQEVGLSVKAMTESIKPMSEKEKGTLKAYIQENSEVLKRIIERKNSPSAVKEDVAKINWEVVTKGTQGASDIGGRDYLGEIEPGIERKPVRKTTILDLFRRKPVSKEYLHYWEEDVVTRDAKFVIACATSTHTTKKTWAKRTVELAKIRDIVDICIDMLDDYDFVESEIRELVDESIMLKADYELMLGASAAATDMLSIDNISSEFNPSNVLADYAGKFTLPTIGDLTAAMKGQIFTFGQENKWMADTVVMNYNDMIVYLHAKDANGVYLFPNFVSGTTNIINGMTIITSPIVAQNTLYVFDSSKGSILDRKKLTVNAYFENNDNAEHELVTFVGVARLQFHVRLINRDAFMKCSNIATALSDITVVVS